MAKNNKPAQARQEHESDWGEESIASGSQVEAATNPPEAAPPTAPAAPSTPHPAQSVAAPQVPQQHVPPDGIELPSGLKESFALLAKLQAIPAYGKAQERMKEKTLARVKKHIHTLQQGTTQVHINANEKAKLSKAQAESIRKTRWEYLARNNTVAAEMLEEIKRLRSQLGQTKTS